MRIEDTSGWTWEQMQPHWPAVMQALRRREATDPAAESAARHVENIVHGRERLWFLFDGESAAFLVTLSVVTTIETGLTKVLLHTMTATDHGAAMGLKRKIREGFEVLPAIEQWAAERGIDEIEMTGRVGLKRLMKPWGYRQEAVVMRKKVGG